MAGEAGLVLECIPDRQPSKRGNSRHVKCNTDYNITKFIHEPNRVQILHPATNNGLAQAEGVLQNPQHRHRQGVHRAQGQVHSLCGDYIWHKQVDG